MPEEVLGKCFPCKEAVLWWEMASWAPLPILAAHWMGPFEQVTWLMLVTLLILVFFHKYSFQLKFKWCWLFVCLLCRFWSSAAKSSSVWHVKWPNLLALVRLAVCGGVRCIYNCSRLYTRLLALAVTINCHFKSSTKLFGPPHSMSLLPKVNQGLRVTQVPFVLRTVQLDGVRHFLHSIL